MPLVACAQHLLPWFCTCCLRAGACECTAISPAHAGVRAAACCATALHTLCLMHTSHTAAVVHERPQTMRKLARAGLQSGTALYVGLAILISTAVLIPLSLQLLASRDAAPLACVLVSRRRLCRLFEVPPLVPPAATLHGAQPRRAPRHMMAPRLAGRPVALPCPAQCATRCRTSCSATACWHCAAEPLASMVTTGMLLCSAASACRCCSNSA